MVARAPEDIGFFELELEEIGAARGDYLLEVIVRMGQREEAVRLFRRGNVVVLLILVGGGGGSHWRRRERRGGGRDEFRVRSHSPFYNPSIL